MSRGWLALFVIAPIAASAADPDEVDQASGRKIHYPRVELTDATKSAVDEVK